MPEVRIFRVVIFAPTAAMPSSATTIRGVHFSERGSAATESAVGWRADRPSIPIHGQVSARFPPFVRTQPGGEDRPLLRHLLLEGRFSARPEAATRCGI